METYSKRYSHWTRLKIFSVKPIFLLAIICICFLLTVGCRQQSDLGNPYYDRMKKLADKAQANPNDQTALHKLEISTTDDDYWNRFYAYVYLEQLAKNNVGGCQLELIPYLDKALKDPDHAISREAASAIAVIGAVAVDKTLPTLLKIIREGKEYDTASFSMEAVVKSGNPQNIADVLDVLLTVANTPMPTGIPDNAPQLRHEALDLITEFAKKNNLNAVPELEQLLNKSESPYKERVAKAILELDPTNKIAQQFVNPSESQK